MSPLGLILTGQLHKWSPQNELHGLICPREPDVGANMALEVPLSMVGAQLGRLEDEGPADLPSLGI